MVFDLPTQLEVAGQQYDIRTDYRDILRILIAFEDPELDVNEKLYVCLYILYQDFDTLPPEDYEAAYEAAIQFIDNGIEGDGKKGPRVMDWEQDAAILFPAINKVAGYETRAVEYLHWWTFMGFFMGIRDGTFSTVLGIRQKKAKGKKLEKWEQEFWQGNQKLCKLQTKLTAEEQAEKDRLNALLG